MGAIWSASRESELSRARHRQRLRSVSEVERSIPLYDRPERRVTCTLQPWAGQSSSLLRVSRAGLPGNISRGKARQTHNHVDEEIL